MKYKGTVSAFYEGPSTGNIKQMGSPLPLLILESMMKTPSCCTKNFFTILLKYCSLDIPEYQSYLVARATLPVSFAEGLVMSYLMLFPKTPAKCIRPFQNNTVMKKLRFALLEEDDEDKERFVCCLRFINEMYSLHFNDFFLETLSKAIFNVFFTSLVQEQILANFNPDLSRMAIQYMTFMLEHISSPKFARCVIRFLFGIHDPDAAENPPPELPEEPADDPEPSDTDENNSLFLQSSLSEIMFFDDSLSSRIKPSLLTSKEYMVSQHKVAHLREYMFKHLELGNVAVWQLMMQLLKYRITSYLQLLSSPAAHAARVRIPVT